MALRPALTLAAEQRLGEERKQAAARVAGRAGEMKVPGAGPEHQAALDVLARSYTLAREGADKSAAWGQRVGREEKKAEWETARQEDRQARGLPTEPPREQPKKGLGLGR